MDNTLGKRLKTLRKEAGWLQKDVGDKLGISASGYGFYESGKRDPDSETLRLLADIFDVTVDYLLGRSNIRNPNTSLNSAFHSISTDGLDEKDVEMVKAMVERLKESHKANK